MSKVFPSMQSQEMDDLDRYQRTTLLKITDLRTVGTEEAKSETVSRLEWSKISRDKYLEAIRLGMEVTFEGLGDALFAPDNAELMTEVIINRYFSNN